MSFQRKIVQDVLSFLQSDKNLIQIITGPRQVGKTTAATQISELWEGEVIFVSADQPLPPSSEFVQAHWERAASLNKTNTLLIIDEVQKINGWSESIKLLWDLEVRKKNNQIKVLLLGSSALLIERGITESLTGRFLLHRCFHWNYSEMKKGFNLTLEEWIFYGGYPGAIDFKGSNVWHQYVSDSLIETVISKDVLQMQNVTKPSLLRHLFLLSASYPAQILSFNKMLGQLQDAGNTTTLSHYLKLLESAFLISGLELYKKGKKNKRGSSPKLILWNNALVNAISNETLESAKEELEWWGRLVENAVGAHIMNELSTNNYSIYYWRERGLEVDFVVESQRKVWAIEVKSNKPAKLTGLQKFCKVYDNAIPVIIGKGHWELEDFLSSDLKEFFR